MSEIAAISFIVLFGVQATGTLAYLFLISRMFSRLEVHYGDVYETLGRPGLFLNNTHRNNVVVLGWLWRKEFLSLSDAETVRRASVVRALLVSLAVNFAALSTLFFAVGALINAG
jgi:hypothetical protein